MEAKVKVKGDILLLANDDSKGRRVWYIQILTAS